MTTVATLQAKRAQHVEAIALIDDKIAAIQAKAAEPKDVREFVGVFTAAIAHIDDTELKVRDLIERGLMGVARTDSLKVKDGQYAVSQVMRRIAPLRTKAFKRAFRFIRSSIGNSPIMEQSLAVWAQLILREDVQGIDTAIRTGLIAGLENTEIARKVVGSAGLNGVDGVTEYTRHKIAHLGRAAIRERRKQSEESK